MLALQHCLDAARTQNIAAQQAGLQLKAMEVARRGVLVSGLPKVEFSAGGSYAPATHRFGYDPAVSNLGQLQSQVIVAQPLYDGGRRRVKVERAELDIAGLSKEQTRALVDRDLEVRQTFVEALRAQSETTLRREAQSDLSDYAQLVRTLQAGGSAASTDLLRTQIELATARVEAEKAGQMLAESKLTLAEFIGTPSDMAFVPSGSLADDSLFGSESTEPLTPPDTSGNLDLADARTAYGQALSDVREAERERWPNLSLIADAGYLNSRGNLLTTPAERYPGAGYSIGVSLDIPVLDWGGRRLQVQQRQLMAEAARLQLDLLQRRQETERRSIVIKMASLRDQLDTLREAIVTAQDNYVLTKAKYAGGGAPASEVLSARQLVTDTKLSELETRAQLQLLRAAMIRLTARVR